MQSLYAHIYMYVLPPSGPRLGWSAQSCDGESAEPPRCISRLCQWPHQVRSSEPPRLLDVVIEEPAWAARK